MDNSILNQNSLTAAINTGNMDLIVRLLSNELVTNSPFVTINKLRTGTVGFMVLNTLETLDLIIANEQNFSDAALKFYADNYLIHALMNGAIVMNENTVIEDIDDNKMIDKDAGIYYHKLIEYSGILSENIDDIISTFFDGAIINNERSLRIFLLPFLTIVSSLLDEHKIAECLNTLIIRLTNVDFLIPLARSICYLFGSHESMLTLLMEDNSNLNDGDRIRQVLRRLFVESGIVPNTLWNEITHDIPLME